MQPKLSPIDRKILRLLQHDASLSAAEIAERVELSQSPCWRRIHRLQEDGVIERTVALLSTQKLGLSMTVFVEVKLSGHGRRYLAEFEEAIIGHPEVLECYTMAGGWISCSRWLPRTSPAMSASCAIICCSCRTYMRPIRTLP